MGSVMGKIQLAVCGPQLPKTDTFCAVPSNSPNTTHKMFPTQSFRNSDMSRSVFIVFRELLNISKASGLLNNANICA